MSITKLFVIITIAFRTLCFTLDDVTLNTQSYNFTENLPRHTKVILKNYHLKQIPTARYEYNKYVTKQISEKIMMTRNHLIYNLY